VAVGGDGTVNEVVNGLVDADGQAELAIVPRGTGVDFVRSFEIPAKLDDALSIALAGRTRTIDLGRATYRSWSGETHTRCFANVASAGMSGAIAKRVNESKSRFAKASYFFATFSVFARWQTGEVRVSVDDELRGGRMRDVVVANCRYFGGGMMICPGAEPDDAMLDALLIGDVTKADLALTLPKIYRGTHLPHPKAELLRGTAVSVDARVPLPIQLDGEQPGTTPVRFEIAPGALRLRVP
jgi:YegS/Rv2252/BmrU family lipid kinase